MSCWWPAGCTQSSIARSSSRRRAEPKPLIWRAWPAEPADAERLLAHQLVRMIEVFRIGGRLGLGRKLPGRDRPCLPLGHVDVDVTGGLLVDGRVLAHQTTFACPGDSPRGDLVSSCAARPRRPGCSCR